VLHTYGDLSDSALLQTYGFIDEGGGAVGGSGGGAAQHAGSGAGASREGSQGTAKEGGNKAAKSEPEESKQREGGGAAAAAATAGGRGEMRPSGSAWANPHNSVLVPFSIVQQCTRSFLTEAMGVGRQLFCQNGEEVTGRSTRYRSEQVIIVY